MEELDGKHEVNRRKEYVDRLMVYVGVDVFVKNACVITEFRGLRH